MEDSIKVARISSVLIQCLGVLMPTAIKREFFRRALGWTIGSGTVIGYSLILCDYVEIGTDCYIGHFNIFRNLKALVIGDMTQIGNFNHAMSGKSRGFDGILQIGRESNITSRHFFDCSGGITIGERVLIGGRDTQLWTHFFNGTKIQLHPLSIGQGCYICARATLIYCQIPPSCVVGAGAVVTGSFEGSGLLLCGNPAVDKQKERKKA